MLSKEELANLLLKDTDTFNREAKDADLSETDFSGCTIEGAVFDNVDLNSSSFADSQLTEVKFINCDLTSIDFNRAHLVECAFNESVLNGADFSYATIDYCNFAEADLAGTIFRDADLSNSDLTESENLSASRFDDSTIWPDNENLPDNFDSSYSDDLSSLKDDDDFAPSDY